MAAAARRLVLALLWAGWSRCAEPRDGDDAKGLTRQIALSGGSFLFGSTRAGLDDETASSAGRAPNVDGSKPLVRQRVRPFSIDVTAVSNAQFRRFVRATRHVTDAEKYRWSFVLEAFLDAETIARADADGAPGRLSDAPHWVAVVGAYWRQPEGPRSSITAREDHPAVHISHNDATAYCEWAGRRLPTELEAEFAARGGIIDEPFPWGGDEAGGTLNGWTGPFPAGNTAADGYAATAPVDAFAPNGFGLYNTVGNVWEWASGGSAPKRPLRGGSFIDSLDGLINHPLRVSTRMDNAGDSGSFNIGFRCAAGDVPNPAPGEGMDQATLAGIVEREGVEGLTAYLAARGKGTQVLSAKDAVVELKSKKARLEAELSALDRDET